MAKFSRNDGWYQVKAAQQSSKVAADITDLIVVWDLSKFGDDFWDNIEAGGGSIRALKGDLDTEIAREVVSCDIVAKTGWVWAKADGTNSSTSDTDFWFAYGKSGESDYAVDGTYGSENVWKGVNGTANDYVLVSHDGGLTDSTANGLDGTPEGGITGGGVAGKMGVATLYDGTDDTFDLGDTALVDFGSGNFTLQSWWKSTSAASRETFGKDDNVNGQQFLFQNRFGDDAFRFRIYAPAAVTVDAAITLGDWNDGAWHMTHSVRSGNTGYIYGDGSELGNGAMAGTMNSVNAKLMLGSRTYAGFKDYFDGTQDENRILGDDLSPDWIATEHNNQDDPGAFWAISDYLPPITAAGTGVVSDLISDLISPVLSGSVN